ncbi:MAG TPA: hypothetical protein VK674_04725 [Candidatus Limnocylindria bacterium]|nr:hypothetical protein [Candidatus Limnocylindria bacterium]
MEVFERGERHRIIVSTLLGTVIAAVAIFAGLVLVQAGSIGGNDAAAITTIRLGTLQLMQIVKSPLEGGGFVVTLEALSGLFSYAVVWTITGVLIAVLRLKRMDHQDDLSR